MSKTIWVVSEKAYEDNSEFTYTKALRAFPTQERAEEWRNKIASEPDRDEDYGYSVFYDCEPIELEVE